MAQSTRMVTSWQGAEIAERFRPACHGSDIKKYIANMIPNHMRPNKIAGSEVISSQEDELNV